MQTGSLPALLLAQLFCPLRRQTPAGKRQFAQRALRHQMTKPREGADIRRHAEISGFPATKITEISKMIDPTTEKPD